MIQQREKWIDYIKVFACVLVALGHFFMSMVESCILPETSLHNWFITTIYYFHVPLFFVCSGYLYQKKFVIISFSSWKKNVLNKAVTLGVPYFVFSIVTWLLKEVFSSSVNTQNRALATTLFLKPTAPYWYLYTLFFIFLVMPTFTSKKCALLGLATAVVLKCIRIGEVFEINVYAISKTFEHMVWFVAGMCLYSFDFSKICRTRQWKIVGMICGVLFLVLSWVELGFFTSPVIMSLLMGTLGCFSVVLIICNLHPKKHMQRIMDILARYTMPIYLMHTIFAAGIRAIMLKIGIENACIHVAAGLTASFVGPVFAAEIMERLKLDILMYPGKYLKKLK